MDSDAQRVINDQLRQAAHASKIKEQRQEAAKMMQFARDAKSVMSGGASPAQLNSFAVALSKSVQPQAQQPTAPKPLPPKTEHKGLDGGVVKMVVCIDNGDSTYSTKTVLVQGTISA